MIIPKLTNDEWHEVRLWLMFILIVCSFILFGKCNGDIAVFNP